MRPKRIRVEDLLLDRQNPRHSPVSGTREAIAALLSEGAEKLYKLASDIAEHGISPIELFLVLPNINGLYTVLEGNRRVAALKLLANPTLATGHPLEGRFSKLASGASVPDELDCKVASSREEAKHWLELRHTGELDGRGVVPWNPEAQNRFSRKPGTQIDKAIMFADSISQAFADNDELISNLETVRRERATTLGRLISDPYVRQCLGLEIKDGQVFSHYRPAELEPLVGTILRELSGNTEDPKDKITVSSLKTKAQRKKYVEDRAPDALRTATYRPGVEPLTKLTNTKRKPAKEPAKPTKIVPVGTNLLTGLNLQNLGSRIANILIELQQLNPDRFPNAAAVLMRSILELSVTQVYVENGWKLEGYFKDRVKRCLNQIDKTGKDPKYQAVRSGLQDGTSVLAVSTLHGYVHNPHYHPSGTELRTIAANYESFLQQLDRLV